MEREREMSQFWSDRSRSTLRSRSIVGAIGLLMSLGTIGVTIGVFAGSASASKFQSAAKFYKSHQLVLITDQDAGSSFDITLRNVAATLNKLDGIQTIVRDLGQAGGVVGDNSIYTAKPDGTTIGLVNFPGALEAAWEKAPGIQYNAEKFTWLGRVADYPPAVMIRSSLGSMKSIIKSGANIKFAMETKGDDAYVDAAVISNIFHFPVSYVTGYESGSDETTAVLRGEDDATIFSYASELTHLAGLPGAKIAMVFSSQRIPGLDVPTLGQVASQLGASTKSNSALINTLGSLYSLERLFAAPPGVPADRVQYLEGQLQRVFANQGFLKLQQKAGYAINPLDAEQTQSAVIALSKDKNIFLAAVRRAAKA
jgi:tripartite-type tricarboxylate transporter receptor subunit TctC